MQAAGIGKPESGEELSAGTYASLGEQRDQPPSAKDSTSGIYYSSIAETQVCKWCYACLVGGKVCVRMKEAHD